MPKKPKSEEVEKKENWGDDQKQREYYYDDAHGYEKYEPEDEGEEDAEGGDAESSSSVRTFGAFPIHELCRSRCCVVPVR